MLYNRRKINTWENSIETVEDLEETSVQEDQEDSTMAQLKNIKQFVVSVRKNAKFHSNLHQAKKYTAKNVTEKLRVSNNSFTSEVKDFN